MKVRRLSGIRPSELAVRVTQGPVWCIFQPRMDTDKKGVLHPCLSMVLALVVIGSRGQKNCHRNRYNKNFRSCWPMRFADWQ